MTRRNRGHQRIEVEFPAWLVETQDPCLQSIGEEVYLAKALAAFYGAFENPAGAEPLRVAERSMKVLEDLRLPSGKRCSAGERALEKYQEARHRCRKPAGPHRKV